MGLSSPLPCPRTARRSGCKGARNAREPATNPCSATGASGSHLRSFASHAKVGKGGANRNPAEKEGRSPGQITPTCARDFPSPKSEPVIPVIVCGADQTGIPRGTGPNQK
jgi:hypothetical protein